MDCLIGGCMVEGKATLPCYMEHGCVVNRKAILGDAAGPDRQLRSPRTRLEHDASEVAAPVEVLRSALDAFLLARQLSRVIAVEQLTKPWDVLLRH
eukprot:362860-Chlamydomonas_euryale.AAC.12